MDKRINTLVENYLTNFKDNLKTKILSLELVEDENKYKVNDLLEYLYEYERLTFTGEDLIKRKRIKNTIPTSNRCIANRANGEQCTRKRKTDCQYCGTHSKGTPHGVIGDNNSQNTSIKNMNEKVSVTTQDICGIVYYIDDNNNIYRTEDIMLGKENPQIIANWSKTVDAFGTDIYSFVKIAKLPQDPQIIAEAASSATAIIM